MFLFRFSPCCSPDRTNRHPGNEFFRDAIEKRKEKYKAASTWERRRIAEAIVEEVTKRSPSGRFLKWSRGTGRWREVGFRKALEKTRQALTDRLRPTKESRLARRSHQVSLLVTESPSVRSSSGITPSPITFLVPSIGKHKRRWGRNELCGSQSRGQYSFPTCISYADVTNDVRLMVAP
jgi:hypothetical protein